MMTRDETEHQASGHRTGEEAQSGGNRAKGDAAFVKEHDEEVSSSMRRAKWVHSAADREGHPGQTLATRNHEVIRLWAQERKATPAMIKSNKPEDVRVLRLDFPDDGGEHLQGITWEEWFKPFDERDLVFIFQELQRAGNQSNFFRLDSPDLEDA